MRLFVSADIYAWTGNDIVLIVQSDRGVWMIARGWLREDTLRDVRTWSFSSQGSALGQIRRLVREADGNAEQAVEVAQAWMADCGEPPCRPTSEKR